MTFLCSGRQIYAVNMIPDIRQRLENFEDFSTLNISFHPTLLDAKHHVDRSL